MTGLRDIQHGYFKHTHLGDGRDAKGSRDRSGILVAVADDTCDTKQRNANIPQNNHQEGCVDCRG